MNEALENVERNFQRLTSKNQKAQRYVQDHTIQSLALLRQDKTMFLTRRRQLQGGRIPMMKRTKRNNDENTNTILTRLGKGGASQLGFPSKQDFRIQYPFHRWLQRPLGWGQMCKCHKFATMIRTWVGQLLSRVVLLSSSAFLTAAAAAASSFDHIGILYFSDLPTCHTNGILFLNYQLFQRSKINGNGL